jgi:hypothetical protein
MSFYNKHVFDGLGKTHKNHKTQSQGHKSKVRLYITNYNWIHRISACDYVFQQSEGITEIYLFDISKIVLWDNQTGTELRYLGNSDKAFTWPSAAHYLMSPWYFTKQICDDHAVYSACYWKYWQFRLKEWRARQKCMGNANIDFLGKPMEDGR